MRNPNGYGSVVKLSGNRRKPYCARKTVGWKDNGQPIYRALGYFADRPSAVLALAEYNRDPYDIDEMKVTLIELYERWSERDFPKMALNTEKGFRTAIKKCNPLHNVPYRRIKAYQMQEIIDGCGGYSMQGTIKSLFSRLDDYAQELDIITKRASGLVHTAPIAPKEKQIFTEEEIQMLWDNKDMPYVDTVLILLYTGLRIGELINLKTENINLSEGYFTGGSKTRAGKNRIVPIHDRIYELIKNRSGRGCEFLLSHSGKKFTTNLYYPIWRDLMKSLGMKHTPHECRHTFRSRLDSAGANKVCIDLIMGHASSSTGERVYTHKTVQELKNAITLVT